MIDIKPSFPINNLFLVGDPLYHVCFKRTYDLTTREQSYDISLTVETVTKISASRIETGSLTWKATKTKPLTPVKLNNDFMSSQFSFGFNSQHDAESFINDYKQQRLTKTIDNLIQARHDMNQIIADLRHREFDEQLLDKVDQLTKKVPTILA